MHKHTLKILHEARTVIINNAFSANIDGINYMISSDEENEEIDDDLKWYVYG